MKKIIALFSALLLLISIFSLPCFCAGAEWVNADTGKALAVGDVLKKSVAVKNTKYNKASYPDSKCLFLLNSAVMMTTNGAYSTAAHEMKVLSLSPKLSLEFIYDLQFDTGEGKFENPVSVKINASGTFGNLPVPVRKGYKFLGWQFDGQLITADTRAPQFQWQPIVLRAMWEESTEAEEPQTSTPEKQSESMSESTEDKKETGKKESPSEPAKTSSLTSIDSTASEYPSSKTEKSGYQSTPSAPSSSGEKSEIAAKTNQADTKNAQPDFPYLAVIIPTFLLLIAGGILWYFLIYKKKNR